jgi:hypothetical protein
VLLLTAWLYHPLTAQVAAAAANTTDDPLFWLANLGTAGVWVVCTITGLQPTRAEVKRLDTEINRLITMAERRDEKDRDKDKAVEALVNLMTSRTLPTLANAVTEIPNAAQQAAAPNSATIGRLESLLSRIEQGLGDDTRSG